MHVRDAFAFAAIASLGLACATSDAPSTPAPAVPEAKPPAAAAPPATKRVFAVNEEGRRQESPFTVWADADAESGRPGRPIAFASDVDGGERPLRYTWRFGDGTESTEAAPTHTFAEVGTYLVDLEVTDAKGEVDTDFLEIEIETAG